MSKTANIVAWDNASGLGRDIDILERALTDLGWSVAFNAERIRSSGNAVPDRLLRKVRRVARGCAAGVGMLTPRFELNLHLEDVNGDYLGLARRNVLIPNQEWFRETSARYLESVDEVWAKSHFAQRLFADLGCRTRYLGWMASDRAMPDRPAGRGLSGLHIAGASVWKGTEALLDVWSANPGWPLLRVLRRACDNWGFPIPWRQREPVHNIEIITDRLEDEALRRVQNESAIHVCPSEAEGFGHVIVEGMSVGAVVITTDAPPMNEIVTRERGLLAAVERSEPMSLGRRYFIGRESLDRCISSALRLSEPERRALGQAARRWFDLNGTVFRRNLQNCLESASSGVHSAA
jgi:Glycosyl transferases group 1